MPSAQKTPGSSARPPSANEQVTVTHCAICEMGCGLKVTSRDDRVVRIEPDKQNPYSWRDFCIKAATATKVLDHPNRLLSPMRRVGDAYVPATYEEAVEDIAGRLSAIQERHGADAVATYHGNPICWSYGGRPFESELNRVLGTSNRFNFGAIDENARHVVGREMYGSEMAYLQIDLDDCDCLVLVGGNPAVSTMSWCGNIPDGWKQVLARTAAGMDLVIIDPRRTESAVKAKLHVAPLPESDWAILLGMIHVIFREGWEHRQDCADAEGVERIREIALASDLADLAARADVDRAVIADLAERFARARTAVCVARTGPAQGRSGAITEWLSHVLNLITGRTDRPGGNVYYNRHIDLIRMVPFRPGKPSRVRGQPPVAGSRSIAELPDEILTAGEGQVRALIMSSGNPVVAGPDGRRLDEALARLELFVVVDLVQRESHRHAHWLIPSPHFLERGGCNPLYLALNSKPFIQMARPAVRPPPGVLDDWRFYQMLGEALGRPLFPDLDDPTPTSVADRALAARGLPSTAEIDRHRHGLMLGDQAFGGLRQSVATPSGRIEAAPPPLVDQLRQRLAEPSAPPEGEGRYQIISRRRLQMMNSWLADTTAQSIGGDVGTLIEIHPADAARDGLGQGDKVRVRSATSEVAAKVVVSDAVRPGVAVLEQGWGSAVYDPAAGAVASRRGINRNQLVSNRDLDDLTGAPRLNGTRVAITALDPAAGSGPQRTRGDQASAPSIPR